MPTLEDALELALSAHRGQYDKAGAPYILHPLRLMVRMEALDEMLTAILHDVVEDSPLGLDDLRKRGYSEEIITAVDALTHRKEEGETYEAFIERVRPNPLARKVKLADLDDNMDIRRLPEPLTSKDVGRLKRYQRARQRLLEP